MNKYIFCIFFLLIFPSLSFSAEGKTNVVIDNKFEFIKAGCFQMGNAFEKGDSDEKPVHEVCLDDFYMGRFEVTVGDFKKFINDTGYKTEAEKAEGCFDWGNGNWDRGREVNWRSTDFEQDDNHPVICVSWNDAEAYIKWLNGKEDDGKYRLPTEAEWEYAARGGGQNIEYSWGDGEPSGNIADEAAKKSFPKWTIWEGYDDGYIYTSPVGTFKSKVILLYDMAGNVWEWTSDWYEKNYYKKSPKNNPKGPEKGGAKVTRGGSWLNKPDFFRVSNRYSMEPSKRYTNGGFRLAYSP